MTKILVLGASGFIGKQLFLFLSKQSGLTVIGTRYASNDLINHSGNIYNLDLLNYEKVESFFIEHKPDVIINCTGKIKSNLNENIDLNMLSVITVLNIVAKHLPSTKLIFFGSAAEYGSGTPDLTRINETAVCSPESPYGIIKYATTKIILEYVKRYNLNSILVRPYNVIGATIPGSLLIGALLKRIADLKNNSIPQKLRVGNLSVYRDFIDIRDFCQFIFLLIADKSKGEIFNACTGNPVKIEFIVNKLIEYTGMKIELFIDPNLVHSTDQLYAIGNPSKSSEVLNFRAKYSIEESLSNIWQDYNLINA